MLKSGKSDGKVYKKTKEQILKYSQNIHKTVIF
jgi:hypothetical protein